MKKVLGILALGLVASSVAVADQDYLKSFSWESEVRSEYKDRAENRKVGYVNFGTKNKNKLRWRNTLNTVIALQDEGDLELTLFARHDRDDIRGGVDKSIKTTQISDYQTKVELSKNYTIGGWDARWTLGWQYDQNSGKGTGEEYKSSPNHFKSKGYANQFYIGPSFSVDYFGQTFDLVLQGVYFNTNGEETADYYKKNAEGWGVNAHIYNKGDILSGKYGTLSYYTSLENYFKDGFRSGQKSDVYIDYTAGLSYVTPSFKGFVGRLTVDNEFSRNTAKSEKSNEANAWLRVEYTSAFDTSIGKVRFTPFVSYRPWNRKTAWEGKDRTTTETNEWRAGFSLGYSAK